ncbi:MAG: hypothetical protein ABID63_07125 [Pseudomonadota bacterium]
MTGKPARISYSILCVLAALMSFPFVMFSPMMFAAPGSGDNPYTHLLFYSVLLFPVLAIAGAILPWIFKRWQKAIWFYTLPVFGFALFVLMMVLMETQCGGDFSCDM